MPGLDSCKHLQDAKIEPRLFPSMTCLYGTVSDAYSARLRARASLMISASENRIGPRGRSSYRVGVYGVPVRSALRLRSASTLTHALSSSAVGRTPTPSWFSSLPSRLRKYLIGYAGRPSLAATNWTSMRVIHSRNSASVVVDPCSAPRPTKRTPMHAGRACTPIRSSLATRFASVVRQAD